MKPVRTAKTKTLEACAGAAMLLGALSLVITLFPILNPIQFEMNGGESIPPLKWYGVGSAITVAILVTAFWLNRRAVLSYKESQN